MCAYGLWGCDVIAHVDIRVKFKFRVRSSTIWGLSSARKAWLHMPFALYPLNHLSGVCVLVDDIGNVGGL